MSVPPSSTRDWDPLPRDLEAIKAWYRGSQRDDAPYGPQRPPKELPAAVVHQIRVSLMEGHPLCPIHIKRLVEYAER